MAKAGFEKKLFYGTAGTKATTECKKVRDVNTGLDKSKIDVTTREADGWTMNRGGLKEAEVEWEMLADKKDSEYTTFLTHFLTGSSFSLYVEDGGGKGLDADFVMVEFSETQDLEEGVVTRCVAVPSFSTGRYPKRT